MPGKLIDVKNELRKVFQEKWSRLICLKTISNIKCNCQLRTKLIILFSFVIIPLSIFIHWTLYYNSDEALYDSHRTADPMLMEIFNVKKISMKALYDNHWRVTAASFRGSASTFDQVIRCYKSFPKVKIAENYP